MYDAEKPDAFPDHVKKYFEEEWNSVEAIFRSDIEGYSVSEVAKDAFRDLLLCHSTGLFRATVSSAFPALEAEFRLKFGLGPGATATSLQEFRDAVGSAPLGIAINRVETIDLIRTIDTHLFERVKTPEALARFEADAVPNRHAATHGLIDYSSRLSSLNAIILADHVLFSLGGLQDMADEGELEAS